MFESIQLSDINQAASIIDHEGFSENTLNGKQLYWVAFPNGNQYPYKELTRRAFEVSSEETLGDEFTSRENGRLEFMEKFNLPIIKFKEGINFFTEPEIKTFISISGESYRKGNDLNAIQARHFKPTVFRSNKWANLLRNEIPDFKVENNRRWQTGKAFRKYTWHKIYKPDDKDKLVFFTIGVDGGSGDLVIKLDCMRENFGSGKSLPKEKVERYWAFINSRPEMLRYNIRPDKLKNWNWDLLINFSKDFIDQNRDAYEDAIHYIHDSSKSIIQNIKGEEYIPPSELPEVIHTRITKNRSFQGREVDWDTEYRRAKRIGFDGEAFIIHQEQLKLKKAGLFKEAKKVEKVMDGEGYDIRTFDTSGNELFIEVKSTTGNNQTPFFISEHEKKFLDKYFKKYRLYRVYNLSPLQQQAEYFIILGDTLKQSGIFTPTNYEVSIIDFENEDIL